MHNALKTDFELRPPLPTTTLIRTTTPPNLKSLARVVMEIIISKYTPRSPRKCNETLPRTLHVEVCILTVY